MWDEDLYFFLCVFQQKQSRKKLETVDFFWICFDSLNPTQKNGKNGHFFCFLLSDEFESRMRAGGIEEEVEEEEEE